MKLLKTLIACTLLGAVTTGEALADRWHHRPRVGVVIGPYWGPFYSGFNAYGPYSPAYVGYPAPVYYPPVVVEPAAPPVYIEQSTATPASEYWYYCRPAKAYYPYVKTCPVDWTPVAARPAGRP